MKHNSFGRHSGRDNLVDTLLVGSVGLAIVLSLYFLWMKWLHLLLNTDGLPPHGYCLLWNPELVTLHVSSDMIIGLSYVAISVTLLYFVLQTRHNLPFHWIFIAFGTFIIACGITHFMEVWTLWNATYWLSGSIKSITAIASVATAIVLPTLVPKARRLIETAKISEERKHQLEKVNHELEGLYTQIADALQQSEQRYGQLAEALPLLVWTSQPEGTLSYVNRQWFDYTGTAIEQIQSDGWYSVIHPHDMHICREEWQQSLQTGTTYERECRLKTAQGSYRWYLVRALPVLNHDGQVSTWVGTATDIEEQKQIQEELRQSEQRKDAFLSMASHELKTPITSVLVLVQLLQKMFRGEQKPLAVQYLNKIEIQVKKLIKLIADLLDVSKMQTMHLALTQEAFDIDTFVHDLVETIQQSYPSHKLIISGMAQTILMGDKDRLGQVVTNLLTNAIKYSPGKEQVEIVVTNDQQQVTMSIRDYGIGIPQEHQSKIFERYYRVYDEQDKKFPGLGIGLYIAAEIIHRHGGEIWVESTPGEGSTFSFSLPLTRQSRAEMSHSAQS